MKRGGAVVARSAHTRKDASSNLARATSLPQRSFLKFPDNDYAKTLEDFQRKIMRSMMVPADLVRAEVASGFAMAIETRGLERQERDAQAVEDWLLDEDVKTTGKLRQSWPMSQALQESINCRCTTVPIKAVDENGNKVEAKLDLDGSIRASLAAAMAAKEDDLIMAREESNAQAVEDWLAPPVAEVAHGLDYAVPVHERKALRWSNLKKLDLVTDIKAAIKTLADFPRQAKRANDQLDALNAAFMAVGGISLHDTGRT